MRERSRLVLAAWVLTAVGVATTLFVGYEFGFTNVLNDRSQQALLADFKQNVATTAGQTPADGAPIAVLTIPRLDTTQVVVQGTSTEDLELGPGHLASSPLPGEFGNVVIMGRRTTYGGAFRHLDHLQKGDAITVTTGNGIRTYEVSTVEYESPDHPGALDGTQDSRLTLVTSYPVYVPSGRLAVVAMLRGDPLDLPKLTSAPVNANTLGLHGDWLALGAGAFWALLLAAAIWLTRRGGGRWPVAVRGLLATPVLLTLVVLLCSTVDRILPGTL